MNTDPVCEVTAHHQFCNYSTTDFTSGAGTAYPS